MNELLCNRDTGSRLGTPDFSRRLCSNPSIRLRSFRAWRSASNLASHAGQIPCDPSPSSSVGVHQGHFMVSFPFWDEIGTQFVNAFSAKIARCILINDSPFCLSFYVSPHGKSERSCMQSAPVAKDLRWICSRKGVFVWVFHILENGHPCPEHPIRLLYVETSG